MPEPHSVQGILLLRDDNACRYFGVPNGTTQIRCLATYLPHPEYAAEDIRLIDLEGTPYMVTNIEVTDE